MTSASENLTTRRRFLQQSAGAALGLATGASAAVSPTSTQAGSPPKASRVVELFNERAVSGRMVHGRIVTEMVEQGLCRLTDQASAADAWRTLLRDDDIIGLKFNHSGAGGIGTNEILGQVLFKSLLDADFRPDQLVVMELRAGVLERRTLSQVQGWTSRVFDFGSGKDALAAVVDQVTAVINIPFLKTHNIAGMSGCLKNISHAFVRHPARFHRNGCDPYVADIVGLPIIGDKLRLHLVNALRIVVDNGPQAREKDIHGAKSILVSRDPVAADTVGQDILDARRLQRNLPRLAADAGKLPILATAARRGLGMNDPDALDHIKIRV